MHDRSSEGPRVSVIIPSHFRPTVLLKVLDGLSRQTISPDQFEVIVVLDGECAESLRMMKARSWPFVLRWFVQRQRGATSARNLALREARGTVIVALDDDVIPTSTLLESHSKWHDGRTPAIVIGTFSRSPESPEPIAQVACDWSHLHKNLLLQAQHDQNTLAALVADGNLSAPRSELLSLGGWDEAIVGVGGSDDHDLARRWLAAGLRLQPEPLAIGEHYWCKTWADHLFDQRAIGRAHKYVVEKNPELFSTLDYARITRRSAAHGLLATMARYAPVFLFNGFLAFVRHTRAGSHRSYGGLTVALIRLSGVMFYLRGFSEGYGREQGEAKH